MDKRLNKIYKKSKKIKINDNTKLVFMSDCHRGDGNNYDNFLKNKNIFNAALRYYYNNDFTYVELGDGDEMWEVKEYEDIIKIHIDSFKLLKKFYDDNRLIMLYGNHDIIKKDKEVLKKYFYKYYDFDINDTVDLLNDICVDESLVLEYKGKEIFLLHGHQVDYLNGAMWKVARFLVRHVWKPLEYIGISDLTSAAKNYGVSKLVDTKLQKWSKKNEMIVIAGHTHRPIFPTAGESLYFNDGSCVHPNGITCLEIFNGKITLVRWELVLNDYDYITAGRNKIKGDEYIMNFFKEDAL